jgi:GNAT superfamily N-acetyltransferase
VIRPLQPGDVDACAAILARLPTWFGIPESTAAYVASLHHLPGFVSVDDGGVDGFVAIEQHFPTAAEVSVMGVDPERHRQGIGRALMVATENWCRERGVEWLHVKTRGPSTYDDDYEKTRRFYTGVGFAPLYESRTEWGPDNASLILVKVVTPPNSSSTSGRIPDEL